MNKIYILLITLLVAVALCACGSSGDATQPNANPTENHTTTQPGTTAGTVTEPNIDVGTEPQPTTGNEETTQPDATEPASTEATEPTATIPSTEPAEKPENPTEPIATEPGEKKITYYDYYYVFTAEEQMAFIESFESIEAFFEWLNAAKEEYESGFFEYDGKYPIVIG